MSGIPSAVLANEIREREQLLNNQYVSGHGISGPPPRNVSTRPAQSSDDLQQLIEENRLLLERLKAHRTGAPQPTSSYMTAPQPSYAPTQPYYPEHKTSVEPAPSLGVSAPYGSRNYGLAAAAGAAPPSAPVSITAPAGAIAEAIAPEQSSSTAGGSAGLGTLLSDAKHEEAAERRRREYREYVQQEAAKREAARKSKREQLASKAVEAANTNAGGGVGALPGLGGPVGSHVPSRGQEPAPATQVPLTAPQGPVSGMPAPLQHPAVQPTAPAVPQWLTELQSVGQPQHAAPMAGGYLPPSRYYPGAVPQPPAPMADPYRYGAGPMSTEQAALKYQAFLRYLDFLRQMEVGAAPAYPPVYDPRTAQPYPGTVPAAAGAGYPVGPAPMPAGGPAGPQPAEYASAQHPGQQPYVQSMDGGYGSSSDVPGAPSTSDTAGSGGSFFDKFGSTAKLRNNDKTSKQQEYLHELRVQEWASFLKQKGAWLSGGRVGKSPRPPSDQMPQEVARLPDFKEVARLERSAEKEQAYIWGDQDKGARGNHKRSLSKQDLPPWLSDYAQVYVSPDSKQASTGSGPAGATDDDVASSSASFDWFWGKSDREKKEQAEKRAKQAALADALQQQIRAKEQQGKSGQSDVTDEAPFYNRHRYKPRIRETGVDAGLAPSAAPAGSQQQEDAQTGGSAKRAGSPATSAGGLAFFGDGDAARRDRLAKQAAFKASLDQQKRLRDQRLQQEKEEQRRFEERVDAQMSKDAPVLRDIYGNPLKSRPQHQQYSVPRAPVVGAGGGGGGGGHGGQPAHSQPTPGHASAASAAPPSTASGRYDLSQFNISVTPAGVSGHPAPHPYHSQPSAYPSGPDPTPAPSAPATTSTTTAAPAAKAPRYQSSGGGLASFGHDEAAEKARKREEQKAALRAQIAEKKARQAREEAERKREEAEDLARLEKERAALAEKYERELKAEREKEEEEGGAEGGGQVKGPPPVKKRYQIHLEKAREREEQERKEAEAKAKEAASSTAIMPAGSMAGKPPGGPAGVGDTARMPGTGSMLPAHMPPFQNMSPAELLAFQQYLAGQNAGGTGTGGPSQVLSHVRPSSSGSLQNNFMQFKSQLNATAYDAQQRLSHPTASAAPLLDRNMAMSPGGEPRNAGGLPELAGSSRYVAVDNLDGSGMLGGVGASGFPAAPAAVGGVSDFAGFADPPPLMMGAAPTLVGVGQSGVPGALPSSSQLMSLTGQPASHGSPGLSDKPGSPPLPRRGSAVTRPLESSTRLVNSQAAVQDVLDRRLSTRDAQRHPAGPRQHQADAGPESARSQLSTPTVTVSRPERMPAVDSDTVEVPSAAVDARSKAEKDLALLRNLETPTDGRARNLLAQYEISLSSKPGSRASTGYSTVRGGSAGAGGESRNLMDLYSPSSRSGRGNDVDADILMRFLNQ